MYGATEKLLLSVEQSAENQGLVGVSVGSDIHAVDQVLDVAGALDVGGDSGVSQEALHALGDVLGAEIGAAEEVVAA